MERMSTEAQVYMRRHQGAKVKHIDVSNVIYHKFSHGAVSYTLSGENVNVKLEFGVTCLKVYIISVILCNLFFIFLSAGILHYS